MGLSLRNLCLLLTLWVEFCHALHKTQFKMSEGAAQEADGSAYGDVACPFNLPEEDPLRDTPAKPCKEPTRDGKYVLFDKDSGQIGDIEKGLTYAATVACTTGRTLVLPPASPWWMFDWGPNSWLSVMDQKDGEHRLPTTTTRMDLFWNIKGAQEDSLASANVDVITFKEFVAKETWNLDLPWGEDVNETQVLGKTMCRTFRQQYPDMPLYEGEPSKRILYWIAFLKVYCTDEQMEAMIPDLHEHGMKNFQTIGNLGCPLTNKTWYANVSESSSPVLYFPNDMLFFSSHYNYKRIADCPIPSQNAPPKFVNNIDRWHGATDDMAGQYVMIKSHVNYRPNIQAMAKQLSDHLGGAGKYLAFHFALFKSDEFDNKKIEDAPRLMREYWQSFVHTDCAKVGSTTQMYVASDMNKSFFKKGWPNIPTVKALFWDDVKELPVFKNLINKYKLNNNPSQLWKVGRAVELLVAKDSAVFIGTRRFSFTDNVVTARIAQKKQWLYRQIPKSCAFESNGCEAFAKAMEFTRISNGGAVAAPTPLRTAINAVGKPVSLVRKYNLSGKDSFTLDLHGEAEFENAVAREAAKVDHNVESEASSGSVAVAQEASAAEQHVDNAATSGSGAEVSGAVDSSASVSARVKESLRDLRAKRDSLDTQIAKEEEERASIQKELDELNERMPRIDEAIARKKESRDQFEKSIQDSEEAYAKILRSAHALQKVVQHEAISLTQLNKED